MSLDDIYRAKAEIEMQKWPCPVVTGYVRSDSDLEHLLDGWRLSRAEWYLDKLTGLPSRLAHVGSLWGIKIFVDRTLPPEVLELRDDQGVPLHRFTP